MNAVTKKDPFASTMPMPPKEKQRTSQGLRDILFDEIENLRTGKGDVGRAKAISGLASQIISAAHLDLEYAAMSKGDHVKAPVKSIELGSK